VLARTPVRDGMLLLHYAVSRGDPLSFVQYLVGLHPAAIMHSSDRRGLPVQCLALGGEVEG
jgi:lipid-A-disaccharide synthase-like uncharacterized protein